jgi:multiple sugar transport system permease protein/putative chitobiose transport system permease protein
VAPIALARLSTLYTGDHGRFFVLSVISMNLLLQFQKQYTEFLSTTGLKG